MTNEKFIPYCVEPSVGVDRLVLAFLCDAYDEEAAGGRRHAASCCTCIRRWRPSRPPCMPLSEEQAGRQGARRSTRMLAKHFMVDYDETGSIGKRYRRQDEIGTPFCICVDFDTESHRQRHRPRPRHHAAGCGRVGQAGRLYQRAHRLLINPPLKRMSAALHKGCAHFRFWPPHTSRSFLPAAFRVSADGKKRRICPFPRQPPHRAAEKVSAPSY